MPLNERLRSLPYKVHTNSELGLMLKGIKALAVFADGYERFPECLVRYLRCFDRCVEQGRLSKRHFVEPFFFPHLPKLRGIHWIYYSLPGEEWRFDRMIELRSRPGPWSADREWEYGKLLGYEDWQNAIWAEAFPYDAQS